MKDVAVSEMSRLPKDKNFLTEYEEASTNGRVWKVSYGDKFGVVIASHLFIEQNFEEYMKMKFIDG